METMLFFAALAIFVLPVISIIIALSSNSRSKQLQLSLEELSRKIKAQDSQNKELHSRLDELETDMLKDGPLNQPSEKSQSIAEETPDEKVQEELEPDEAEESGEDTLESFEAPPAKPREDADLPIAAREQASPSPAIQSGNKDSQSDLENKLGGKWSILLGGFTLALGLVFMVQYSIEAGLLGPGPRTLLGGFFSVLLLAAGELLRRSDKSFNLPVYEQADVPGILTGAGIMGAFATLYAAHALYGFIGPGIAFAGLTIIGLASLLLSSLHGPKLAAIGALGAYATPLLVVSNTPNPIALALHTTVVTAAVMGVASLRKWTWLAIAASVFSALWVAIAAITVAPNQGIASSFMIVAILAIFVVGYGIHQFKSEVADDTNPDSAINLTFTLLTLAFAFQLLVNQQLPELPTAILASVVMIAGAIAAPVLGTIVIHASSVVLFTTLTLRLELDVIQGITTLNDFKQNTIPPNTTEFVKNAILLCLPPVLLALWGSWNTINMRPKQSAWLASAVSAISFFALLFVYLRIAPFETRPLIGTIGIALALLLVFASEAFGKRSNHDENNPAPAALLVGTVAVLSLAAAIGLNVGWLPLAFSLTALGISGIYILRPFDIIPWLALASGILAGIALWFNMPLEYPKVSRTLIFNGLLLLLAAPALCMLFAGELMRFTGQANTQLPSNALTAIGLGVFGLFIAIEVIHIVNDGRLSIARQSLAETSGHALAALFMAFGLRRIAKSTRESVFTVASQIASAISVTIIVIGLLVLFNPYLLGERVGSGLFFNLLLPGYLLTGLAAGAMALYSRGNAPRWYTLMYAALSGSLLFTYASLMLRKTFQGEGLSFWNPTSDLEIWLYSPLWLGLGAIILAVGIRYQSTAIRAASGLLIILTIIKVFLYDMAQLEGFLRAISFIGLGISLIIVGRFYQRLLTKAANSQ